MAQQLGNAAAGAVVRPLRGMVGGNPAMSRLLDELERYARVKGEQVIRDAGSRLTGLLGQDGAQGVAGKTVAAALGMVARNKAKRGGGKPTLVVEDMDVAVPVTTAYDQWTQLDTFGEFMKSVEGVEKQDEVRSTWRIKIGPSRRSWSARITEQLPDRRIQWTSEGAKGSTRGVVTFHPLVDDLTRIALVMEYYPQGPVERVGTWLRFPTRRSRNELRNFRRFVTERGEATGAWRGEIRDGEVVDAGQDDQADQGRQEAEEAREARKGERAEEGQRAHEEGREAQGAEAQGAEAQGAEAQGAEAQGAEAQGAEAQGAEAQGAEAQGAEAQEQERVAQWAAAGSR